MATLRSQQVATMNSVKIQSCSMDYLCDVIFSRPVTQKLFPDNVIVVEYFPIEPLRSNIDYLMREEDLYFAIEKCTNDVPPRSVSFGVLSPRVKFMHWCATVYFIFFLFAFILFFFGGGGRSGIPLRHLFPFFALVST